MWKKICITVCAVFCAALVVVPCAFADDSSYYLLCSLEMLDDEDKTKLKSKADMFTKRTIKQQRSVDSVDTAAEALALSIGEKARVDMAEQSQPVVVSPPLQLQAVSQVEPADRSLIG